jgi:hypothetical protein
MSVSHRPIVAASALVLAVSGMAAGYAASASAAAPTARTAVAPAIGVRLAKASTSTSSGLKFSRMTIVDEQRPGFEPDVKINSKGVIYSSVPYGFSTTQSFVWSSRDFGNSYHFVPGIIGPGKPKTCAGGGDTDLWLDSHNYLYFSDLQGLTNISNSESSNGGASWSTTCSGVANSPDDRMWFAGTGSLAGKNLHLYQDFDQVGTSGSSNNLDGNQLVETVSTDGTEFLPVVNNNPTGSDCVGGATNCVTDNEGISGNQVVEPSNGHVFIAHTTLNGNSAGSEAGVAVAEGVIIAGNPTTGVWHESPNLDGPLCPNSSCVSKAGNPEELAGENFASIARDSAGYLYVTFTAGPVDYKSSSDPNFGELTKPEQIYVVHSLEPDTLKNPAKLTWSKPQRVTGGGISAGTNTFPWVTAGSDGRVAVAYYHTNEISEKGTCGSGKGTCTNYGASRLTHAEWTVQLAETLNGHASRPSWTNSRVSETSVKYGPICTNGLGCTTGGDRSLGDFLQVDHAPGGALLVSYVFDVSGNVQGGEDAGPEVVSRQIAGPSLIAGHKVTQGRGPGLASNSVRDWTWDAEYSQNGHRYFARQHGFPQLDLTGASLVDGKKVGGRVTGLIGRIDVASLKSLAASTNLGGTDASWMLRWTVIHPGVPGNGLIYYAGMDNNAAGSGTPSFFTGSTSCIPPNNPEEHCKYLTYPQTTTIKGSIDKKTGVITLTIPAKDVGGSKGYLPSGEVLFSVTAFTATSTTPQSATTIFNLIDSTPAFDHRI